MAIFKLKTPQSYAFKLLAELLQNCVKEANFIVKTDGIHLSCKDVKSPGGTICVEAHLEAKNFPIFKLRPDIKAFPLGLDLHYFYRVLKKIKKRDTLMLEIDDENEELLSIIVQQNVDGQSNPMTSTIRLLTLQKNEIVSTPNIKYNKPIIATSKEFARLRQLHKLGDKIQVTFGLGWISFFISKADIITEEVQFGEKDPNNLESWKYDFIAENITQLVKVAGLSPTIQIYTDPNLIQPLKFQMNIGNLGELTISLKSDAQIEDDIDNSAHDNAYLTDNSDSRFCS